MPLLQNSYAGWWLTHTPHTQVFRLKVSTDMYTLMPNMARNKVARMHAHAYGWIHGLSVILDAGHIAQLCLVQRRHISRKRARSKGPLHSTNTLETQRINHLDALYHVPHRSLNIYLRHVKAQSSVCEVDTTSAWRCEQPGQWQKKDRKTASTDGQECMSVGGARG